MKKDYSCQNNKKIVVIECNKMLQIDIQKISYIQCNSNISTIYFADKAKLVITAKLLKQFEAELSELGFVRANRNTLVNAKYIEKVENYNNKILTLVTNEKITISCRRLSKIRKILCS